MSKPSMKQEKKPKIGETKYTPEIAAYICEQIALGRSLRSVCRDEGMPNNATVNHWVIDDREGFAKHYARARLAQMSALEDDLLEIADVEPGMTESGATDSGYVAHQKLKIDTRKWLMSKIAPKKYGEKLDLQHTGADGNPIEIKQITRVIVDPKAE